MFFIPGQLIALATFPGVIVHEMAHQLFCRLTRTAILDVCYFRFGNPAGYVIHETPLRVSQHLLIGLGPFFVNSFLGALIALPGVIPVLQFEAGTPMDYAFVWLGLSIAMHAFPSTGDAKSMWKAIKTPGTSVAIRLVGMPLVGAIYLGALGSVVWLDLAYGVALAFSLPTVLISLFG